MIHYKDKVFCSNKNCDNSCGRKVYPEDWANARAMGLPIALIDVCGSGKHFKQSFKSTPPKVHGKKDDDATEPFE